jgi:hypothetical protein
MSRLELMLFVLMMTGSLGGWLWCRRNPSFRRAQREWGTLRDLFGIKLLLKHPVCHLIPVIALFASLGGTLLYAYLSGD